MDLTADLVANRKAQLIEIRDKMVADINQVLGAIKECDMIAHLLSTSAEVISQEEMDKVKEFPASDSR